MNRLPARYRTPIVVCFFEGKTHEEAAHQLGWPRGTVASRLARGRELLRRRLVRRGVTLTAAALGTALSVLWHFTDTGEHYLMELSNGVLIHHPTKRTPKTDLTITLTHPQLLALLASGSLNGINTTGDQSVLHTLLSLTDQPDPNFPIVTP